MPTPTITAARVANHEALYPRLAALESQIVPIAGKKPELAVPLPVFRTARALLGEIQARLGRRQRLMGLGGPTDFATLAVALGQARMALEGLDAAHMRWEPGQNCLCWRLADGDRCRCVGCCPQAAPAAQIAIGDGRTIA